MKFFFFLLLSASLFAKSCPLCNDAVLEKQKIYETNETVVLYCLTPAIHGNILIVPKRHMEQFSELTSAEMIDIQKTICVFAKAFPDLYNTHEYVLIQKNGRKAGQSVDHIHFHMIPSPVNFDHIVDTAFHYRSTLSDEEMKHFVDEARSYFKKAESAL